MVELKCVVHNAKPKATIVWFRENVEFYSGKKTLIFTLTYAAAAWQYQQMVLGTSSRRLLTAHTMANLLKNVRYFNLKNLKKVSLFRNKRIVLDEMTQRNASKFGIIFLEYKKPYIYFFFILCYFIFSPNEYPGLRDIDQGINQGKITVAQNEKQNYEYVGFCIPKIWQILKYFSRSFHQA